jgi:hypothetical protein
VLGERPERPRRDAAGSGHGGPDSVRMNTFGRRTEGIASLKSPNSGTYTFPSWVMVPRRPAWERE